MRPLDGACNGQRNVLLYVASYSFTTADAEDQTALERWIHREQAPVITPAFRIQVTAGKG